MRVCVQMAQIIPVYRSFSAHETWRILSTPGVGNWNTPNNQITGFYTSVVHYPSRHFACGVTAVLPVVCIGQAARNSSVLRLRLSSGQMSHSHPSLSPLVSTELISTNNTGHTQKKVLDTGQITQ